MEGFINLRMRPWLRRLITRMIAVVPAVITIWHAGDAGTYQLLIFSQIILSMQLPFAVIPLVQFTSDRKRMGDFATPVFWRVTAWIVAGIIVVLNMRLASTELATWLEAAGEYRTLLWLVLAPVVLGLLGLLAWIVLEPILPTRFRVSRAPERPAAPAVAAPAVIPAAATPIYRSILLPLDHSEIDGEAITHAVSLARAHGAKVHILHVEEGVTSQVFGDISSTAEIEFGKHYFETIIEGMRAQGIDAELVIAHGKRPKTAIIEAAGRLKPDLIVMGAHGHRGIQDLALGKTIDGVRHAVDSPVLIVRSEKK